MARYSLNLPLQLKQAAETFANQQGVSLNQFILWAVSEKVGALSQMLDDPAFPRITYHRGTSGVPVPVIRGTGIRVQTIVVARNSWNLTPAEIADQYDLSQKHVNEALAFFDAHKEEIEGHIEQEDRLTQEMYG